VIVMSSIPLRCAQEQAQIAELRADIAWLKKMNLAQIALLVITVIRLALS